MDTKELVNKPHVRGHSYKDVYISLITAKLLKQLDFYIPVDKSVTEYTTERVHEEDGTSGPFGWEKGELEFSDGYFINNSPNDYSNDNYTSYAMPTQSVLQSWLREVHGIRVWVSPSIFSSAPNDWAYNILIYKKGKLICNIKDGGKIGLPFEYALEQGLQIGLEQLMDLKNEDKSKDEEE